MGLETQFETEITAIRALCNEATTQEERKKLLDSLSSNNFIEPEHQVVFESIRALFPRGPISAAKLQVHLNNRGFPDTDVEKYFQPEPSANISQQRPDK